MTEDKSERHLPNLKTLKLSVTPSGTLPQLPLPDGISYDYINCKSSVGLSFHILESGYDPTRPLILLLHEFPGLAYSWRKIMPALASANYYVVAVDQRGYGRTTGWDCFSYDATDLDSFTMRQYVADMVALVYGLGYKSVRCIVGHDFGAGVASMCALMRPDFFKSCVLISTPFSGVEGLPTDTPEDNQSPMDALTKSARDRAQSMSNSGNVIEDKDVHFALAQLNPPRKHYRWYNSFHGAASDYRYPPQGLNSFLRGFFHIQSAHMKEKPQPLDSWTAAELSKLPSHYIMPLYQSMPETVAACMDSQAYDASRSWLSDEELAVYVQEFSRTGFQGALNYFRVDTDQERAKQMTYLAGARMEVPVVYIGGNYDWGNFEDPGILQLMPKYCRDFRGVKIIKDAGHWPQQEQPGALTAEILSFLWNLDNPRKSPRIGTTGSPSLNGSSPKLNGSTRVSLQSIRSQGSNSSPGKQPLSPLSGSFRGISPPRTDESPAQQDRTIAGQIQPQTPPTQPLQRRESQSQLDVARGKLPTSVPSSPPSDLQRRESQSQLDAARGRLPIAIPPPAPERPHASYNGSIPSDPHTKRIRGFRRPSKSRRQEDVIEPISKEPEAVKPGYNFNPPLRRKPTDPDTPHPDVPDYNDYPILSTPIIRPVAPTPESHAKVRKDTPVAGPGYRPQLDDLATLGGHGPDPGANGHAQHQSQEPPMSPVGFVALDASERNAEIYKQVSEQARQKLEDAEKHFRRMGKDPKRRNYSEDGTKSRRKESRDGRDGQRSTERRATPFETDMVVGPPTPGMRL